MDEIKELKSNRKTSEDRILDYLEREKAEFVNISNGKLIRNKSETKGSLKAEMIRAAITEGITNDDDDPAEAEDKIAKIMDIMDGKRTKTIRINLKRTKLKKRINYYFKFLK